VAGYAPAYPETALDSPDLAPVMGALAHVLDAMAAELARNPDERLAAL
jgi:hypothetical protein